MYGDPVFYNCMTFTEALGLDKSSECIRDGPLENLWGVGGGGGRSTKKIFAQGKIKWKKIHARQFILKNIHALA